MVAVGRLAGGNAVARSFWEDRGHAQCCCDIAATLLRQGRRINTVLSVIKCSLTRRRRIPSTWRRTIPPVVNSGGKSIPFDDHRLPHLPSQRDLLSLPRKKLENREWYGVEDETRTRIVGTNDRSYDRALKLRVDYPRRYVLRVCEDSDMSDSTEPVRRSRVATRRIEFDQVLLSGDEQSELRESAGDTPETADLTWGGGQFIRRCH